MNSLACLLLASAAALTAARKDLARAAPARVLLDLDGPAAVAPEEASEAAALLSRAAEVADGARDRPLALQLAERARKLDPTQRRAIQLLAEWALADHEFSFARHYADQWAAIAPADADQRRFVERLELLERDFHPGVIVRPKRVRARTEPVEATAARAQGTSSASAAPAAPTRLRAANHEVILYGTSWCPYCRKARDWLQAHHVRFADKDIEQDPRAAMELARKRRALGGGLRGVPVIDIDGALMAGYSAEALQSALGD